MDFDGRSFLPPGWKEGGREHLQHFFFLPFSETRSNADSQPHVEVRRRGERCGAHTDTSERLWRRERVDGGRQHEVPRTALTSHWAGKFQSFIGWKGNIIKNKNQRRLRVILKLVIDSAGLFYDASCFKKKNPQFWGGKNAFFLLIFPLFFNNWCSNIYIFQIFFAGCAKRVRQVCSKQDWTWTVFVYWIQKEKDVFQLEFKHTQRIAVDCNMMTNETCWLVFRCGVTAQQSLLFLYINTNYFFFTFSLLSFWVVFTCSSQGRRDSRALWRASTITFFSWTRLENKDADHGEGGEQRPWQPSMKTFFCLF